MKNLVFTFIAVDKSLLRLLLSVAFVISQWPSCYAQHALSDGQIFPANVKENVVLRSRNAKHFVAPDGKATARISSKPIHYLDATGQWQDINCSLQASSADGYIAQNTSNSLSSYFPADARKGVQIRSGDGAIKIGIDPMIKIVTSDGRLLMVQRATSKTRVLSSGNTITYSDLFANASNSYHVDPNQIKNNLVLTSLPNGLPTENAFLEYSEQMQLPAGWNLSGGVNEKNVEVLLKGELTIVNEHEQAVFSIPVPDVFELSNPSNGIHNDGNWENTYKARFLGQGRYEVSTRVPVEWLSDPSRSYPVVIDPTVTRAGNYGGWQNTFSNYLNGNPTTFVFAGLNDNGATYNGYTLFDISSIPVGSSVTNTRLSLEMNGTGNGSVTETVFINNLTGVLAPYGSYSTSVFDDLGDGPYTSFACTGTGTYGFFDLGTDADNDVMSHLSTGQFQVGLSITSATTWKRFSSNLASLEVTYTYVQPPSGLDLEPGSDTGGDNADDITSDQTPTISGAAPAGATIRLYAGITEIGSVTSNAVTGNWQITSSLLAEGVYTITATTTDGSSNVSSASSPLTIAIDITAPAAPTAPDLLAISDSGIDTDNISNDNTPTISGTAEVSATVKLYDGATEIGSSVADATTGAWQITASSLADGLKTLTAKAIDIAGNVSGASSVLSITIDTSAPAAPTALDLLAISDSGIDTDNTTNDDTPDISGTAEVSATVKLYDGATEIGSSVADATTGAWQITASSLADGPKTLTAKAIDIAGNMGGASSVLSITIDTSAPAAPTALDLLAISDSGIDTDNITNDDTPDISGTAEVGATVKLYDGATEIGSSVADATTGAWQITASSLADGPKTLTAKAIDIAGNVSVASSVLSITIDTSAPALPAALDLLATSDSGIDTDNITNDNTPTISGTAEVSATVKLYDGATEIGSSVADATTGAWQITASSLADSPKTLTAKAIDIAGNVSGASSVLAITIDTSAPAAPTALDLLAISDSGIDTDNITNDDMPDISGIAEASVTIKLYDGATEIGSTIANATTGAWQIIAVVVADGTKSISAKATDIAGNASPSSLPLVILLDRVRPVLTVSSPSAEKMGEPFTVIIDVEEDIIGFDISDIMVMNGTASQFAKVGSLQYTVLITPASQGQVTISIPESAATDIAGNGTTGATLSREFDNSAPEGYTIHFVSDRIDIDNVTNVSLIIESAEVGATYFYTISSNGGGAPVSGSGVVATIQFAIDGLNLEGLENGLVTATIFLKDDLGHRGDDQTAQITKAVFDEVTIYTSFSPNGDGINDIWKAQSLVHYSDVEIEVFDRAGVRVFYTKDPNQGWDGRNQNGHILTGGYLYIVRVKDTDMVKKGVLTLLK